MKALEDDMCTTLVVLRRHINPLESPLYHLLPDLLPKVTSHLTSETDLVNVTHVSYHLRNNLLSYPSLWSRLDFRHEMRARAFFERSGRTPLHINMPENTKPTVGSLAELRRQSKRITTLKLHRWSIQKILLSEPLPSLRRLGISYDYGDDDWEEEWTWTQAWGPTEEATSWSFPSLTSLIVYNIIPIPFYTPHLTCFKFWDKANLADTNDLLRLLDNCPLLEHIDVLYSDKYRTRHDLIVSLPNLRTYTETTFDRVCPLTVLNVLVLPSFCSVTLRFRNGSRAIMEGDAALPHFKNPDYLAGIKRVKVRTTHDIDGNEVVWALELISTEGTRVCSERMEFENGYWPRGQHRKNHLHDLAHLNFLRNLDGRSVEALCIDGCARSDRVAAEFLEEVLCFGNVRTLILSRNAAELCLSALNRKQDANVPSRWFLPIYALIIRPDSDRYCLCEAVLEPLLSIARKRKVAGFPFRSVSLFLWDGLGWGCDEVLEELREYVEELEVILGDDVLDWDVDKYFLDGLDRLQKNLNVQWD